MVEDPVGGLGLGGLVVDTRVRGSIGFESLNREVEAYCVMEWHSIALMLVPSNPPFGLTEQSMTWWVQVQDEFNSRDEVTLLMQRRDVNGGRI
jgi:hypothetical protein